MDDINIAMLIDADNVSSKYIPGILSELSKYGKITVRRMYGDWSQDRLHSWLNRASGYSLTPVMQPNNTPGKNASDIGLIIDAMDILYTGDVQGFCIVSSDGDFNKLATRLREAGKVVIGMGEKKTPESFRVSCERFIFLDVINGSDNEDDVSAVSARRGRTARTNKKGASGTGSGGGSGSQQGYGGLIAGPGSGGQGPGAQNAPYMPPVHYYSSAGAGMGSYGRNASLSDTSSGYVTSSGNSAAGTAGDSDPDGDEQLFTSPETIEATIVKMIEDNNAEGKETGLGEIGSRLVKIFPDFDIRNYHYSKLSEFLKDLPSLSVESRDSAVWVSLSSSPDSDIESQILKIFDAHHTDDLYISTLKKELEEVNSKLDATIRKSGVTRFSVYLNRMIPSVQVNGRHVMLRKD
ncbi:MAG: NYN domain-containing protein [Eubacteriales bacterium]|nr:NYN domain-containing protein [Eubacteriales bacterium]